MAMVGKWMMTPVNGAQKWKMSKVKGNDQCLHEGS